MLLQLCGKGTDFFDLLAAALEQQPGRSHEMHTAVEDKAALVTGLFAPVGFVVLAPDGDHEGDARAEGEHTAERGDLLRGPDVRVDEAEVFGYGVGGGCVGWVRGPGEQFASSGEVLGNGLFGKDVLAGCQGLFDVVWLCEDGKSFLRKFMSVFAQGWLSFDDWGGGGVSTHAMTTPLMSSRFSKSSKFLSC